MVAASLAELGPVSEERTATVRFDRPEHWRRLGAEVAPLGSQHPATSPQAELRVGNESTQVRIRSRPSDNSIADECLALLARLPGAGDGVIVVGCDIWTAAGAPARLVEYARLGKSARESVFTSHLLIADGRNRTECVVDRSLVGLGDADGVVFAFLETVRALVHTRGGDRRREPLPSLPTAPVQPSIELDTAAFEALQALAGKRWTPSALRSAGGRALVDAGLVSRFGAVPTSTSELIEPFTADRAPLVLEQRSDDGAVTRLRAFARPPRSVGAEAGFTVVDGDDAAGYRIGAMTTPDLLRTLAGRLGVRPTWTWAFRTPRLPAAVFDARAGAVAGAGAPQLAPSERRPEALERDEALARFWAAPWTVSSLHRPGDEIGARIVRAHGVGFARVGRATGGQVAFRAEAPANVFRTLVGAVTAAEAG